MLELLIALMLKNFSVVMLVAALVLTAVFAWSNRNAAGTTFCEQLLRWLLLLSVGLQGVYTFVVHVFFSEYSARNIGWAVSPFQYEVGIADLTVGVLGIIAFWSNFSFRVAAVIAAVVWYGGDAIGHVRQMIVAHNFAPGNAGPWFWTDVLVPILLIACAILVWRKQESRLQ
jgi:Family of unknown function (DUF6790)